MKHALATLSFAAALAIAGAASAEELVTPAPVANPTTNDQLSQDPLVDVTGKAALGVDISRAGGSPESIRTFVASLSADQQRGVTNACTSIVDSPNSATPPVVSFCTNLISG